MRPLSASKGSLSLKRKGKLFFHAFYYISGPIGSLFNDHEVHVNAVRDGEAAAQDELSVGGRKREQPRRLESD